MSLLSVDNLHISLAGEKKLLPIVQGISFELQANQTLGIVGESGCGKSVSALAIMGLLQESQVTVTGGSVMFDGQDVLKLTPHQRRSIMGDKMAMIFQEPMTSLNPVYRIGDQIIEMLRQHRNIARAEARKRTIELLDMVRIPEPSARMDVYPHQLSGGQRQRVMIAMALACEPQLLIADEPTTALDVTVQKEVLELIADLQHRTGTAILLISHDLGVVANTCDRVAVMYRGRIVESAPVELLFTRIGHPYTLGLLGSIPSVDHDVEWLAAIPGKVPMLEEQLSGCAFHPRCGFSKDNCRSQSPSQRMLSTEHQVLCHYAGEFNS